MEGIKKGIRKVFSIIFGFAILFGGIFIWEGLYRWQIGASLEEWLPMTLTGMALATAGMFYHRNIWIFRSPMNSRDMKMYVEGKQYEGKGE